MKKVFYFYISDDEYHEDAILTAMDTEPDCMDTDRGTPSKRSEYTPSIQSTPVSQRLQVILVDPRAFS